MSAIESSMTSSQQVKEDEDQDDNERNFWRKTFKKIYANEQHSISAEQLKSILTKIKQWFVFYLFFFKDILKLNIVFK